MIRFASLLPLVGTGFCGEYREHHAKWSPSAQGDFALRQFGWQGFDLLQQRRCVVDAGAVDEEDDSACACDGDEEPRVEGEAEEGGAGTRLRRG